MTFLCAVLFFLVPDRPNMSKSFIRSVGSVFTGALIAQLIPIVGTLVLARIFSPESFGVFSVWLGAVLFLGVVLTCRFETSLAIEDDGQPRQAAVVMIQITIGMMSLAAAVLVLLAAFAGIDALTRLPVALLVASVPTAAMVAATQTLQNWAAADGRYRQLTIMRIAQATAIVLLQIVIGLAWTDAVGLGCGYFIGVCFGLLVCIMLMPIQKTQGPSLKVALRAYWKKRRRFAAYSLPADAVNAAASQLPVLIVAARFGAEAAGLLAMAIRMLGAPMSLLAASVLDVFKRHAGQAYRERGECVKEYAHAFRILVGVAALSGIAILVAAEPIFDIAFGQAWLGAGTMAIWLLPRFSLGFVASPLSYMAYIAEKQHIDLLWQLALLIMTFLTLMLANSEKSAVVSYSVGYGLLYLIYIGLSYNYSLGAIKARG